MGARLRSAFAPAFSFTGKNPIEGESEGDVSAGGTEDLDVAPVLLYR